MKVNLLPRKEFELIAGEKVIYGRFSNWAIIRLCEKMKMTRAELQQAFSDMDKVETLYAELLLSAVEFKCRLNREPFNFIVEDAFAWMEDIGGYESEQFISLMFHAFDEDKRSLNEDKKKAEELSWSGTNSEPSAMQPG